MIDDLFVPDPPAGDSSNRIPTTRFVQNAATSAAGSFPSIAGLSVVGNASTAAATAAAITGTADQLLAVNHAGTTVLFESVSSYIDNAISSTQGAILYRNASTWVPLAPGTNGQFLQTQGAAANPQWAGAAVVLLNTLSPNAIASVSDTTSFTNTYSAYRITFDQVAAVTANPLQMQITTNGTTWVALNYVSIGQDYNNLANFTQSNTTCAQLTVLNVGTTAGFGFCGELRISNPAGTGSRKLIEGWGAYAATTGTATLNIAKFAAYWDGGNNAIVGVNFKISANNIATGTLKIYGLN